MSLGSRTALQARGTAELGRGPSGFLWDGALAIVGAKSPPLPSVFPALVGSPSPFAGPNQSLASLLYLGFHKVARVVLYTEPLTLSFLCFKPAMDFPPEVGSSSSSLSGVHGPP